MVGARVGVVEGNNVVGILDGSNEGVAMVGACVGSDMAGVRVGGHVALGVVVGCKTGDDVGPMGFSVGESDGISDVGHTEG